MEENEKIDFKGFAEFEDEPEYHEDERHHEDTHARSGESVSSPERARHLKRGGAPRVPAWAVLAIVEIVVAAALLCCARFITMPHPLWLALNVLAVAVGLLPVAMRTVRFLARETTQYQSLIMLLAVFLLAASGRFAEAASAAIIYNILMTLFEMLSGRESERTEAALEQLANGQDVRAQRLSAVLKEASSGRISAAVKLGELENYALLAALVLAFIFGGVVPLIDGREFSKWIPRAVVPLIACTAVSDPAVTAAYLKATRISFGNGVYFSGMNALSAASEISSIFFNKTGTLTRGRFEVVNVDPVKVSREELLYLASYADAFSDHPIAEATLRASGVEVDRSRIIRHQRGSGYGSIVKLASGEIIAAGNADLMERLGVRGDFLVGGDTSVFVSVGRTYIGRIDYEDAMRPDAVAAVSALRRAGVANIALMTGDNALSASTIGRRAGISEIYSDCQPEDKLARLQYVLDTQERDDRLAYVTGAGRDMELLELANISIVMGISDDVTDTFPDVVIDSDDLGKLPIFISAAKQVRRSIGQNFIILALLRTLTAVLGVFSVVGAVPAAVLMGAAGFCTVLNTRVGDKKPERDLKSILEAKRR